MQGSLLAEGLDQRHGIDPRGHFGVDAPCHHEQRYAEGRRVGGHPANNLALE